MQDLSREEAKKMKVYDLDWLKNKLFKQITCSQKQSTKSWTWKMNNHFSEINQFLFNLYNRWKTVSVRYYLITHLILSVIITRVYHCKDNILRVHEGIPIPPEMKPVTKIAKNILHTFTVVRKTYPDIYSSKKDLHPMVEF